MNTRCYRIIDSSRQRAMIVLGDRNSATQNLRRLHTCRDSEAENLSLRGSGFFASASESSFCSCWLHA